MKIRNKILLYFSSVTIAITGLALIVIYLSFAEFREEEFQMRQKEKIITTLTLLAEIKQNDDELLNELDKRTINNLFDEKLLLFNHRKELIYSSIDDTPIPVSKQLLGELNETNKWIETKDGLYDVVATYVENNNRAFYGISKAYDTFGYAKLGYLKRVLIISFSLIVAVVVLVSLFLAKRIAQPLSNLANLLSKYRLGEKLLSDNLHTTTYEINYLNEKFNELVERTNEAFAFQKHSIHHISHQLKTPIAVLVSELEVLRNNAGNDKLKYELESQISKTKSLADVINVLLEISKFETGQQIQKQAVRIDEIIFDCVEELNTIYPDFNFEVNYFPDETDAGKLTLNVNEMLIKQAFQNLLNNCVAYSSNAKAEIKFDCSEKNTLKIFISNSGKPLSKEEEKYLFNHFFRGENSRGKIGFGLGLVLSQKIIALHSGIIVYSNPSDDLNVFEICF